MSKHFVLALGATCALILAAPANAVFLPPFTGHSQAEVGEGEIYPPATRSAADGLINFAVYENLDRGDWATELGVLPTAMPLNLVALGLDTDAAFVFFYQAVNTNPAPPEDVLTEVQIERGIFTSGGFLSVVDPADGAIKPAVFDEAGVGPTGGAGNPALGPAPVTDPIPGDHVPGFAGALLDPVSPFAPDAAALTPDAFNLLSRFYEFEFPGIGAAAYTTVLFLTSDVLPPQYLLGRLHDGDQADGDVPSNTPELGTFAMTFGALMCGVVAIVGARRKTA